MAALVGLRLGKADVWPGYIVQMCRIRLYTWSNKIVHKRRWGFNPYFFYTIFINLSIFVLLISHISNFSCCRITVSIVCLRILSTCILCWLSTWFARWPKLGIRKIPLRRSVRVDGKTRSARVCVCVCVRVLISCLRNADVGIFCVTRLGM